MMTMNFRENYNAMNDVLHLNFENYFINYAYVYIGKYV